MMKNLKLVLVGIIPIIFGYILNDFILEYSLYGTSTNLIGVVFLLFWGLLSYFLGSKDKPALSQAFSLCFIGLIMLVLMLFQEIVMGQYWINYLGLTTQMYYLPTISLGSMLTSTIFMIFFGVITASGISVFSYLLMLFVSYKGFSLKSKN